MFEDSLLKVNFQKMLDVNDFKKSIKKEVQSNLPSFKLILEHPNDNVLSAGLKLSEIDGGLTWEDPIIVRKPSDQHLNSKLGKF